MHVIESGAGNLPDVNLGFTLSDASTRTRWQFTNGVDSMHVNVVPEGKNVITYVGR